MESIKSGDQQDLWAENSQKKRAFIESLEEQSTKWKCFVMWLFVIGVRQILANKLMAKTFIKQQVLNQFSK
jgi:hypothetical protein